MAPRRSERERHVHALITARWDAQRARRAADPRRGSEARRRGELAKVALGERAGLVDQRDPGLHPQA